MNSPLAELLAFAAVMVLILGFPAVAGGVFGVAIILEWSVTGAIANNNGSA